MTNYIVRILGLVRFGAHDQVQCLSELTTPTPAEVAAEVGNTPRAIFVRIKFVPRVVKNYVGIELATHYCLIPDELTPAQREVVRSIAAAL